MNVVEAGRKPGADRDPAVEVAAGDEHEARVSVPQRWRTGTLPALRRRALRGAVVIVVLLFVWLICAGPVAHLWYQSRQQGLRSEAASASTQLGSEKPEIGHEVAVLEDPTVGLNVDVAQGSTPQILRGGPGHLVGTPLPGARGNSVVVGHARDWGDPFRALSKLNVGSELYLQAHPGVFRLPETGDFIYTVRSTTVTSADDVRFAAPTTDYRLTLVTDIGRIGGQKVLVVTLVSGTLGKTVGSSPVTSLDPTRGRVLLNGPVLLLLLTAGVVVLSARVLRRGHRNLTWISVLIPLVAFGTFLAFLEFDVIVFRPLA